MNPVTQRTNWTNDYIELVPTFLTAPDGKSYYQIRAKKDIYIPDGNQHIEKGTYGGYITSDVSLLDDMPNNQNMIYTPDRTYICNTWVGRNCFIYGVLRIHNSIISNTPLAPHRKHNGYKNISIIPTTICDSSKCCMGLIKNSAIYGSFNIHTSIQIDNSILRNRQRTGVFIKAKNFEIEDSRIIYEYLKGTHRHRFYPRHRMKYNCILNSHSGDIVIYKTTIYNTHINALGHIKIDNLDNNRIVDGYITHQRDIFSFSLKLAYDIMQNISFLGIERDFESCNCSSDTYDTLYTFIYRSKDSILDNIPRYTVGIFNLCFIYFSQTQNVQGGWTLQDIVNEFDNCIRNLEEFDTINIEFKKFLLYFNFVIRSCRDLIYLQFNTVNLLDDHLTLKYDQDGSEYTRVL